MSFKNISNKKNQLPIQFLFFFIFRIFWKQKIKKNIFGPEKILKFWENVVCIFLSIHAKNLIQIQCLTQKKAIMTPRAK